MCREDKVDIFNIMSGNCYHTEAEAQADEFIQLRRLSKARESLNEDFIIRFSKHLDRVRKIYCLNIAKVVKWDICILCMIKTKTLYFNHNRLKNVQK